MTDKNMVIIFAKWIYGYTYQLQIWHTFPGHDSLKFMEKVEWPESVCHATPEIFGS